MISVIVPVYNAQNTLSRCVNSILAQSLSDWELLLVNDGSTDGSAALCDTLAAKDARIRVLSQENAGVGAARNTGLDNATGEYIAFVDSDDFLPENALQCLFALCQSTGCKLAVGGYVTAQADGTLMSAPQYKQPCERVDAANYYLRLFSAQAILYVVPWGKLYHRSLFDGLRYPALRMCDDEALIHLLVHRAHEAAVCHETVYFYTLSQNSIMRAAGFSPALYDQIKALQLRAAFFAEQQLFVPLFETQKLLLKCIENDLALLGHTPADTTHRKTLCATYRATLREMQHNPAASRRLVLKLTVRSLILH